MSMSDREIDREADRYHDCQLHDYLDSQEAQDRREEAIDAYVNDNMNDRILAWLDESAEGVLFECVSETSAEETNDATAARMVRAIASGDDISNNYELLGRAFYAWMLKGMEDALEPELRDDAEKELSN